MTIIESIRAYFMTSPFFDGEKVSVDPVLNDENTFALNTIDNESLVKKYADGGTIRKYDFLLSLKLEGNGSGAEEALELYEAFSDWLTEQVKNNNLPQLSGNKSAFSIETLNHGHMAVQDENKRIYQVQCRLVYYI